MSREKNLLLEGDKFNYLTIIDTDQKESRKGHCYYKCRCICGVAKYIRKDDIVRNSIISCGCMGKESHRLKTTIPTNTEWLLTKSKARDYFIGFLLSDGYISKNNQIGIQLIESDIGILKVFSNYIFGEDRVQIITKKSDEKFKRSNMCRLVFTNMKFLRYLKDIGFTTTKTIDAIVDFSFENSNHFWRGAIDGDGCLCYSGTNFSVSLTGTKAVCDSFKRFIESNNIEARSKVNRVGDCTSKVKLYRYMINGINAFKIADILYTNSEELRLDRKYEKYINILEKIKQLELT